jgi:dolichol-phosphate mannosyltransferase
MSFCAFVILPAFNEAEPLSTLVDQIGLELKPVADFQIVVVDDGSTDSTSDVLRVLSGRWPMQLLRHDRNRGYGAALKTGLLWVSPIAQSSDIVITLDADNTHSPVYLPALVGKIVEGFDVVTASYWMTGGRMNGVPLKRRLMSRMVNVLFRVLVPIKGTRCFTNGFRAYRMAALQSAFQRYGDRLIEYTGFPGGAELFLKVATSGAKTAEIPFVLHYENRGSASKIRVFETIWGYLRLLMNARQMASKDSRRLGAR